MISVFTPFHKKETEYLFEAFLSMKSQQYKNWEWVILLNGNGVFADLSFLESDRRIKIIKTDITGNIGALKKKCAEHCTYPIIAELDYDDILTSDCLEEINNAFKDEKIQMVYSNSCEFHDGTWHPNTYSEYWGWRTRPFIYEKDGLKKELIEMISWKPSPHSFRRIFWSPNHIRAWRKSAYEEIGGHDTSLKVADDHDLCCRTYLKYGEHGIYHIDKCLYLYRVHSQNSVKILNAEIQVQDEKNYIKYSRLLAERWCKDNNLKMIDLGGRFDCPTGYISVDRMDADVICDLNKRWVFKDNSVGIIRASHILEHLENPIHAFNEAYRILAPGGFFFIDVPSTDGRGAFQDPTHKTFWNENSFWYYTNDFYARYIRPEYKGRFQASRVITWFPSDFFRENNIPCVQADLICLKPPYSDRQVGEKLI